MGITSNGGSVALLEGSLAIAAEEERSTRSGTFGTSARGDDAYPLTRSLVGYPCSLVDGDGEDAPNFGVLPRAERLFLGEP